MATADRDGAIAQALLDRTACLSMSMHESLIEARQSFDSTLADPTD